MDDRQSNAQILVRRYRDKLTVDKLWEETNRKAKEDLAGIDIQLERNQLFYWILALLETKLYGGKKLEDDYLCVKISIEEDSHAKKFMVKSDLDNYYVPTKVIEKQEFLKVIIETLKIFDDLEGYLPMFDEKFPDKFEIRLLSK